ncbi:MAG TPA: tRNA cyclic N6-threonylcarbamoyladenosine(37) synthase TcdA, partial [Marinobacter sp.]|nr:tRNA cyclic N6-threonylcarbamoyladenosine(37) synthase TcdA [Marinobacter sp.]
MASTPEKTDDYEFRFGGIERLYGRPALQAFRASHL